MRTLLDPPQAAELLLWARKDGFTAFVLGGTDNPHVIVLSRRLGRYIDVAHVRGADRTEAARIPYDESASIWWPRSVVWHYFGHVIPALEALRQLPPPHAESAPHRWYEPPRAGGSPQPLTVTDAERVRTTVCPP